MMDFTVPQNAELGLKLLLTRWDLEFYIRLILLGADASVCLSCDT